jgi:hypothetical protein
MSVSVSDTKVCNVTRHERLFEEYVAALRERKSAAEEWWTELLAREIAQAGSEAEARRRLQRRWPFATASHPFIIATYRHFFLLCEALNEQIELQRPANNVSAAGQTDESQWGREQNVDEAEVPVPGWVLLIDMLEGRHADLATFMQGLVFKPIASHPNRPGFF